MEKLRSRMNAPGYVWVLPDFEIPFELHIADYEEDEDGNKVIVADEYPETKQLAKRSNEDNIRIMAKTAEFLLELGMDLEKDKKEYQTFILHSKHKDEYVSPVNAIELLKTIQQDRNEEVHRIISGKPPLPPKAAPVSIPTTQSALKLAALLTEYDKQVVQDALQLRTYITNRLIEISSCGIAKDELRALELLGKISDVGLFVEKSEINITTTSPAQIEHAIKEKINRLLGREGIEIEDVSFEEEIVEKTEEKDEEE